MYRNPTVSPAKVGGSIIMYNLLGNADEDERRLNVNLLPLTLKEFLPISGAIALSLKLSFKRANSATQPDRRGYKHGSLSSKEKEDVHTTPPPCTSALTVQQQQQPTPPRSTSEKSTEAWPEEHGFYNSHSFFFPYKPLLHLG